MLVIISAKRQRPINLNNLAKAASQREGLKKQTNIAQIAEVQRHTIDLLAAEFKYNPAGVIDLLRKRG